MLAWGATEEKRWKRRTDGRRCENGTEPASSAACAPPTEDNGDGAVDYHGERRELQRAAAGEDGWRSQEAAAARSRDREGRVGRGEWRLRF